ncbi:MAG: hypothetical protein ACW98A_06975 [Candidatus Hodarchaeales archaeon]
MLISSLFIINSYGVAEEIGATFGKAPIIDGEIDDTIDEWKTATKNSINLTDLPIDLWVMQDATMLYISVQVDLELSAHNSTEFIGLLISNSSSENQEDFIDAKIVQFSNILTDEFVYLDYFINNTMFLNDTNYNGEGAGKLNGKVSVYEFSIPIKQPSVDGNEEDVLLEYENIYALNITYGKVPSYPEGIIKSEIVLIEIFKPSEVEQLFIDLILLVLTIIVFSIVGILSGYYIYKIFKLKEKMERLKS